MNQLFVRICALPGRVCRAVVSASDAIHEIPYRAARRLPTVPGLVCRGARRAARWLYDTETAAEVRSVWGWMVKKMDAIHDLPYRFARWLPTVPELTARKKAQLLSWAEYRGITPRLTLAAPLFLSIPILMFCLQPFEREELTYVLSDGSEPEVIFGFPEQGQQLSGIEIVAGDSGRDAQLVLSEGQSVSVRKNGVTQQLTTRRETVANLLRRAGVSCDADEMVVVDTSGRTPALSVQRAYSYDWQQDVPVNYETEYVAAPLVDKGTETEVQSGVMGNIRQFFRDIYRNGRLVTTELLREDVTEPINQVIEQGTRVREVSRSDRIEKVFYNEDGSGYLLFKSGDTMTFSRRITCSATAYSIGKWTASGLPTKVGHIAVDRALFAYHTRFYIYTNDGYCVYGNAVAADCGTAIKGYKIDLWFETYDEACRFGRRDCTVFVLN